MKTYALDFKAETVSRVEAKETARNALTQNSSTADRDSDAFATPLNSPVRPLPVDADPKEAVPPPVHHRHAPGDQVLQPGPPSLTPVRDDPGPRADSPGQGLLRDGAQTCHSPAPGAPDPVQRLPGALRRPLPHNAPGLRAALLSLDGGRVLRGGAHRPGQGDIGWCSHSTHQGAEHPKLSVEIEQQNNL